jgi:hypothetical protein
MKAVADEFELDYATVSRIVKNPGCDVLSKDLTPCFPVAGAYGNVMHLQRTS